MHPRVELLTGLLNGTLDMQPLLYKVAMLATTNISPGSHLLQTDSNCSSCPWSFSQPCSLQQVSETSLVSPYCNLHNQNTEVQNLLCFSAGQLIVSMFVFVNKLNYANGCLSSIFYVAAAVLVAQDAHIGSKLNAAAFVIGPLWFGAVLAGLAVSLVHQFHVWFELSCWRVPVLQNLIDEYHPEHIPIVSYTP